MIICCPACNTRYVVPDSAIGVDGRTVRCAKCRHSWFQDGPQLEVAAPKAPPTASAPPPPPTAPVREEPVPVTDDFVATEPPTFAPREVNADSAPSPAEEFFGDQVSQFDHQPPFQPRRNWMKLWTAAAAVFAAIALGMVVAVGYWGVPDWVPVSRPTFAQGRPDLVLEFPPKQQDRRTLPNGTEFFGASGTVTNAGKEVRSVPPILIVLRDAKDRIVYSWEVAPPKRSLAPGESMAINEAVTDVPRSAKFAEIGWKPD
jgi:predicted Zn finger-like uncharacterized protein